MALDVRRYDSYRPRYASGAPRLLHDLCGLARGDVIADVGSGTGIFSAQLLDDGYRVFGVEPLAELRELAEARLDKRPGFSSVAGAAENTTLPAGSVRTVTVASALHWFDSRLARHEFKRILLPPWWCIALWNFRLAGGSSFAAELDGLWRELLGPPPAGNRDQIEGSVAVDFFVGCQVVRHCLPNPLRCSADHLVGLFLSSSHAPDQDDPARGALVERVNELHRRHEADGLVVVPFETVVFVARL